MLVVNVDEIGSCNTFWDRFDAVVFLTVKASRLKIGKKGFFIIGLKNGRCARLVIEASRLTKSRRSARNGSFPAYIHGDGVEEYSIGYLQESN